MEKQERERAGAGTPSLLSRRTIALSAVWSVPVILAATAAPAAAASNPPVLVATGTLVHATGTSYSLTMAYTFTGPSGSTATVSVTGIQAVADSGDSVIFTPLPDAHSVSIGTTSFDSSVDRHGPSSLQTATVFYSYIVVVNGKPITTTASAVVLITHK